MPQNLGANHPLQTPSTTQTLTSSAGPVTINFSFINDADVLVFLGGTLRTNGTGNNNYTINNDKTQVTFNNDVSGEVIVTRKSDLLNKVRTFAVGASVRSADLNTQFDQVMQLIQDNYEVLRGVVQNDDNDELTVGRTLVIKDDAVVTGSILDGAVTRPKIATDAVDGTKIADNAIDSEHYTDGSIDRVHLSNDIIDGSKLADDSVDSEHYVADSIDTEHYAPNSVDTAAIAGNAVTVAEIADAELKELATMSSGTASALADLTGTEVQILDDCLVTTTELNTSLDGCTATAAEINTLDGVNATLTADELNILDGATVTAAELNTLDGVNSTLTAADLNQLDSNTLTTSATWTSDIQFPSAKNIDDRITARIDPIGGYEAIANEDSFPAAAVPEGTIISIANVGGMVVPAASGSPAVATTTDASRAGGSDTVTIQNIPATAAGQTLQDGLGMLVVATSTAHTYDFHRVVATDQDVIGLSRQMDDFAARYRVGNTLPTDGLCGLDGTGTGNRPCDGDMFFNTGTGKMVVYDGDAGTADNDAAVQARWEEVQSIGNFKIIPASELADFASGSASVETITDAPTSAEQIVLSINGVIQEPVAGTTAKLADDSVTAAKLADSNTTDADRAVTRNHIRDSAINADKIDTDAVTQAKIADEAIDEARLQVSNAPTNGQFLSAQSGNTGGLTWATVSTATPTLQQVLDAGNQSTTDISFNNANGSAIAFDASQGSAVFNDQGQADGDFRVESDNNQHMLFVDAGNNRVGIATDSPTVPLDVGGEVRVTASGNTIHTFANNGDVVLNEGGAAADFRIESNLNTNMLFVDGSADAVGINESTPNEALDVRGNVRIQDGNNLILQNGNENQTVSINADDCSASYTVTLPPTTPTAADRFLAAAGTGADQELEWTAASGTVLQCRQLAFTSRFSASSGQATWTDVTGFKIDFTPESATSTIIIQVSLGRSTGSSNSSAFKVIRDTTDVMVGDAVSSSPRGGWTNVGSGMFSGNHAAGDHWTGFEASPGTSQVEYQLQYMSQGSATTCINQSASNDQVNDSYGLTGSSSMVIWEIEN